MKRFIFQGALLFLILIIINISFWGIVKEVYWTYYKKVKPEFNNYIFGDSHGIRIRAEDYGYFNFSAGSDSYFDMLRKLNFLIRNTKVDTVVISVEDHTLSKYREKLNNKDRSVHYTGPKDFDNLYLYLKEKYIKNYFVLLNGKQRDIVYRYLIRKIKNSNKNSKKEVVMWNDLNEEEKLKKAKERAKTQFSGDVISESTKDYLKKIIETCSDNNIHLVGIKYPLSNHYIQIINRKSFYADSVFIDYDLPIYDFSNIYLDKDEYFYDQDHLNKEGAIIFTEVLINTIRNKSE